jgi:hypothetical protein
MSSVLATALAFARHGHAIFPVNWPVKHGDKFICSCGSESRGQPCGNAAKHPYAKLAPHGLLSATTDSGIIKHWFGYTVPEANLGVRTDKLIVVDIDPRHDGDETFNALIKEHGELPPTWRVRTGGGGDHILFACPDGLKIASFAAKLLKDRAPLGPGIDIRARDGYIVAPPSRHITGKPYAWSVDHHPQDVPLAPPPSWLVEKLSARSDTNTTSTPVPSGEWAKIVSGPVTEYRDLALARIVGHLLRHWVDTRVTMSLAQAWNACHCVPPLTYGEVSRIVNRVANREADRLERESRR